MMERNKGVGLVCSGTDTLIKGSVACDLRPPATGKEDFLQKWMGNLCASIF